MKRWIVLSLLLVPLLASAAGFWDGNATLQRGDASFESGLYAASNSFRPGTQITIQNQDTGKTVTATITGRIEGQSDILVLLSPKTAEALGLPQGTLGRVRVTVPPRADSSGNAQPGDQTVSSDPDVNPGAAYGAPDRTQIASAPTDKTTTSPALDTPTAAIPAAQTPATVTPAETTPEPPAISDSDNAAIISAAQSRTPQKQVFQPPREDEKFVYQKPSTVPPQAVGTTTPAATQQGAPTITAVVGESGVRPAPQPASDLALASPEPAPEAQVPVGREPVRTEVTGPAAVPPATTTTTTTTKAKPPAQASVQTASSLPRTGTNGTYFLQIAAYGTEKVARDLAAKLAPTYPALVLTPSRSEGSSVFKVVIGPLNRAESGTLLTWFRYRGFPDAFLKQE